MRKILSALMVLTILTLPAQAKVFKGKAVDRVYTKDGAHTISVKSVRNFDMDGIQIKKGYVLTGQMTGITSPESWHHNASFTFIPHYYTDNNGTQHQINKTIKATYRQKMKPDYRNSHISGGIIDFSPGYVPDTIKVFKGEGKEVAESYYNRTTPWGKGTEIEIKPNETIYFNFPD